MTGDRPAHCGSCSTWDECEEAESCLGTHALELAQLKARNEKLTAALQRCLSHFEKIRGDREDSLLMAKTRAALASATQDGAECAERR